MFAHEKLLAWQRCHELALAVYRVTESFPKHELYGLTSQARRAAVSAAANIAEGAAKRGAGEFRRFLDIALGSIAELAYLLRLAKDLHLLNAERSSELSDLQNRCGFLTWRLYRAVSRKAVGRSVSA